MLTKPGIDYEFEQNGSCVLEKDAKQKMKNLLTISFDQKIIANQK